MVCALSMLAACKTYYKRGGDGDSLAADQAECQRRTGDAAGERYEACMQERGWANIGEPLEAEAPAAPVFAEPHTEKTVTVPSQAVDSMAPGPEVATPAGNDVKPATPPREAITTGPPAAASETPKSVGTWFKLGGSPAQLKADQTDCMKESQPSGQSLSWSAEPGFIACMRNRGWRALAE